MNKVILISKSRAICGSLKELLNGQEIDVLLVKDFDEASIILKADNEITHIIAQFNTVGDTDFKAPEYIRKSRISQPVIYLLDKNHNQDEQHYGRHLASIQNGRPVRIADLLGEIKKFSGKRYTFTDPTQIDTKTTKIYSPVDEIIGQSPQIEIVKEMICKVAPSDVRVLISGENGTGKELVAKCIHLLSQRQDNAMIEVNCAAMPSELIESELFGHEKGAFTSASKTHRGKFEAAHNSTLFLDEIGDMSLSAQAKVLRALQENKICRVGGDSDVMVDTRIIAATNKNLKEEISQGRFREDLYHRLSVVEIVVPSLNDRITDIPILAKHFMDYLCKKHNKEMFEFDEGAIEMLQNRNWSGNIRELQNALERLVIFGDDVVSPELVDRYVNNNCYSLIN